MAKKKAAERASRKRVDKLCMKVFNIWRTYAQVRRHLTVGLKNYQVGMPLSMFITLLRNLTFSYA